MELRQLRYLLAIAETENFTRAAEKLFISQSALSQQIQTLEQAVGTILLDRSKRGVRLTEAGEILCHHARRVVTELEQAQVAMRELEGLTRGELHVGVVQTVNAYLMPSMVSAFTSRYPDIKLRIDELAADDIESGLEIGALEVGIGFFPPTNANVTSDVLFEERLVLVVRDDHPFAAYDRLPVKHLHEIPMMMLAHTFCTRRLWEENARLAAVQPNVVLEMNTVSSILSVVLKTGLPTILPEFTLIEERAKNLVSVQLHSPTPSRQVALLWHGQRYLCSASRAFIQIARETAAQFVQNTTVAA